MSKAKEKNDPSIHGGKRTVRGALGAERARADKLAKLVEESTALLASMEGNLRSLAALEAAVSNLDDKVAVLTDRIDKLSEADMAAPPPDASASAPPPG